jgi:transcriptional regulator with XRE-family HTH domain
MLVLRRGLAPRLNYVSLRSRFSAKLRKVRHSRGWTQEQLAEKANVSLNLLNMIERGERAPSFDSLERLAKVLRVTDVAAQVARSPVGD